MKYLNTRAEEVVSFKEATLNGLGAKGGLYVPESIPQLPASFYYEIENLSDTEIATTALWPFVEGSLTREELQTIVSETLSFPTPVKHISENVHVHELFHGPTYGLQGCGGKIHVKVFISFCRERL